MILETALNISKGRLNATKTKDFKEFIFFRKYNFLIFWSKQLAF